MSFFTATDISTGYGAKKVIDSLSFTAKKGELLGILGANGSGKTTLLKSICGILPRSGKCTLNGQDIDSLSPRQAAKLCSYIPQRSGIQIDISALDVVLMGFNPQLRILERPTSAMVGQAKAALVQAGLAGKENENYLHLSEGQKQLCILARTLVAQAPLLLLDEPESALDFRYRYRMLRVIRKYLQEGDRCAIVTLHDPALALNHCDALLLIKDGRSIGVIRPGEDDIHATEQALSLLYGPVCLRECLDHSGKRHIVMLSEQEEEL